MFPEGFSVRQMTDRVAGVRKIAIRKRGVTPRLTGGAYKAAAAGPARRALWPFLKRRSVEGFLFPSLYEFTQHTRAAELVANQLSAFESRWRGIDLRRPRASNLNAYDVLTIASMIERETVVASERRLVSAVIYNRLKADMPLAIDATLRYGLGIPGTRPLTSAPPQPQPLQHTPLQGAAADADRQPRGPVDARRRGRRAQLPLLPPPARHRAALLHGERGGVLREGSRVGLHRGLLNAGRELADEAGEH